jgi:hypothetical protein
MFEGLNGQAQYINHSVQKIQLSIMRRWTRRQTVIAIAHGCMVKLAHRAATDRVSDPGGILKRPRQQPSRSLLDIGSDLVAGDASQPAYTDADVDVFIRMSQSPKHRDGSEFLPGGLLSG